MRYLPSGRCVAVCLATWCSASAQFYDYDLLHYFGKNHSDGDVPLGALVEDGNRVIYGTTTEGGGAGSEGVVFRVGLEGTDYNILHTFNPFLDTNSLPMSPVSGVIVCSDGNLYGTTSSGFTTSGGVFRVAPNGDEYETLWMPATEGDAVDIVAPLVEGRTGALYGTARSGGDYGHGCIFRLDKDGSGYRALWSFGGQQDDGVNPWAGLVQAPDGALYGTTIGGGASGGGTLFRIQPDGSAYTTLLSFIGTGGSETGPVAPLLVAGDGALYGTTLGGGSSNAGTVFRVSPDGLNVTTIYEFAGPPGDGKFPYGSLIEASDGLLYGTCSQGGRYDYGTVFKLTRDGTAYAQLHSFLNGILPDGRLEGTSPVAGLLQASNGALYGVCSSGTLFRFFINGAPQLEHPITSQVIPFGSRYSFTLPPDTFSDPDVDQTLHVGASGLPPGITFDPASATFTGSPGLLGSFHISVVATDDHPSPRSVTTSFVVNVVPILRLEGVNSTADQHLVLHLNVTPPGSYTVQGTTRMGPWPVWVSLGKRQSDSLGALTITNLTGVGNQYYTRIAFP